jgi:hypothetical protein
MHTIIQRLALHLLVKCAQEWWDWYNGGQVGPEPKCPEYYWDLMYLYRFGLPKILGLEELDIMRWWNRPQPDPLPFWNSGIESLFLDVLDAALGDPHPQPYILREIYGNTDARLNSVKKLSVFYENALVRLNEELTRLEQLQ